MSSLVTSTINCGPPLSTYLATEAMVTPAPGAITNTFAQKFTLPDFSGGISRHVQIPLVTPVTTPSADNTQGSFPVALSQLAVDIQPKFYVQSMYLSVQNILQNQIPLRAIAAERLEQSMIYTEDYVTLAQLLSTPSRYYCVGGTNGDYPTEPSINDMESIATAFDIQNAMPYTDAIRGEDRFGTAPQATAYMMFANSALDMTFRLNASFQGKEKYPNPHMVSFPSELGQFGRVRILTATNQQYISSASRSGATVYMCPASASLSYAIVHQAGLDKIVQAAGAAYSGYNMMQNTVCIQSLVGSGITQSTWVMTMLCTGGLA